MVTADGKDFEEMDLFLDGKVLTANNKGGGPLEDISNLPDFKSYFTFSLDGDFSSGPAYTMLTAGDSE